MSKKTLTLIALAATLQTTAQQDTATHLDDVVVTATKFPIKTSSTGKVITIITKQQLEQSGGKDLSQIINEQSGVLINGANSSAGKDKSIYLRGASVQHTLITIDGIPTYDASGIGSNFDIRNINIDLVERIEILRGSESTLYGSDAIAGVINIITKKNDSNKKINGTAIASYGSFNTFNGGATVNGKLDKIAYSIGYNYLKTDGINEANDTTSNRKKDDDGYKQEAFNANFNIAVSKNISIQPYLRYTWIKSSLDQGAGTDELDFTYTQKSFQTGIRNELKFGNTKLNVLYGFNKVERNFVDDSTLSQNGFAKYYSGSFVGKEHFVDAYTNFALCSNTKLTVGADYRTSSTDEKIYSLSFFGPYETKYSGDSVKQNQLGIYGAINYSNLGLNIQVGGRYNNHSVYGNNTVFSINPSYQVTDDIKVFANVASAYRTPSLYQLFSEFGNKNLKPEVAFTTELGVQHYFFNKDVKAQFVLFNRDINDVHYFYTNYATYQSQYINQDKERNFGIEFELQATLCKNTNLKLYYNYTEGFTKSKTDAGKDTSFNNLIRRPNNLAGLNFSTKPVKDLFVSVNAQWVGDRLDAYGYPTTYTTLSNYAVVDMYAEYGLLKNKLKLFANAKNLTDTKFTEIIGYNTMGFNVYGGARFKF